MEPILDVVKLNWWEEVKCWAVECYKEGGLADGIPAIACARLFKPRKLSKAAACYNALRRVKTRRALHRALGGK